MEDSETTNSEFLKARDLAERLYELQSKQADSLLTSVNTLMSNQAAMQTDVAVIKTQTAGLPERVQALENLRYKIIAILAAILLLMWVYDHIIPILSHVNWNLHWPQIFTQYESKQVNAANRQTITMAHQ